LVGLGVGVVVYSLHELEPGGLTDPGPGLWPLVAGCAIVVTSLPLLLRGDRDHESLGSVDLPVAATIAFLAIFIWLMSHIGFALPAAALIAGWMRIVGKEGWLVSSLMAVATPLVLYLVFAGLLTVPLPAWGGLR